jgi:hypothetical protein
VEGWPELPYEPWRGTRHTLHMYTQVIGKLRLALSPFEPNWGHVPLYVSARGLSTSPMPTGHSTIDVEFDFIDHDLVIRRNDGRTERRPLGGTVADFYEDVMGLLRRLDVDVALSLTPTEVPDPIPFPDDRTHDTYEPEPVSRLWQALSTVDVLLKEHRARFRGRTSPVEFFWGTFDLALNRYSGKRVEPPAGAGVITRVGGDAEQICCGWWPGDERTRHASFWAYGYPAPPGIETVAVRPDAAGWSAEVGEFLMTYDAVRTADDPPGLVREFLESSYSGIAPLMGWDQTLIDVHPPKPA